MWRSNRHFFLEENITMTTLFEYKQMAYKSTLKSRALSVLMYLTDRADKKAFTCFPAIKTIAAQLHISISTVKRAMKELLDSGFLQREARFAASKNGGQTSNLYTLTLPQNQHTEDVVIEIQNEKLTENLNNTECKTEVTSEIPTKEKMCTIKEKVPTSSNTQIKYIDFNHLKQENIIHQSNQLDQIHEPNQSTQVNLMHELDQTPQVTSKNPTTDHQKFLSSVQAKSTPVQNPQTKLNKIKSIFKKIINKTKPEREPSSF